MIPDYQYENMKRIVYGDSGATFVRVCTTCFRFVKADESVLVGEAGLWPGPNATCTKCGRTTMLFEGFIDYGDKP